MFEYAYLQLFMFLCSVNLWLKNKQIPLGYQSTKKIVSDSLGLVDFAIMLVNSVVNFPDGQVRFFEQFK